MLPHGNSDIAGGIGNIIGEGTTKEKGSNRLLHNISK